MASKKTKQGQGLGRSLIRQRDRRLGPGSDRHTTDITSTVVTSITENTSLEEFLSNAEAAQRSFEAERGNAKIVRAEVQDELIIEEDDETDDSDDLEDGDTANDDSDDDDTDFCSVPKKPHWNRMQSAEEFQRLEQLEFLKWKKKLNRLQSKQSNVPPFEKNIEFWRQFWKMIEISDVVIQVVDSRDPLFYFSQDLAVYVKEVSGLKENVLLVNKADYLSQRQRELWSKHFLDNNFKAIFFSALDEDADVASQDEGRDLQFNSAKVYSPIEVLQLLQKSFPRFTPLTVGFLGYPNVGKSSTINRFLTNKRLQVSATPGKTKHYQTHVLNGDIVLVDGPGLVIPNIKMTKADMVLAGILPIDNLTDYQPSVDLLLTKLSFSFILKYYGVMKTFIAAARKSERKNVGAQLTGSVALMRGFMKNGGVPDHFRAAKIILKEYVQGKLLFAKAPPSIDQVEYFAVEEPELHLDEEDMSLEESFPELRVTSKMHVRGVQRVGALPPGQLPSKKMVKNKKKEKTRRLYKDNNPYTF